MLPRLRLNHLAYPGYLWKRNSHLDVNDAARSAWYSHRLRLGGLDDAFVMGHFPGIASPRRGEFRVPTALGRLLLLTHNMICPIANRWPDSVPKGGIEYTSMSG